MGSKMGTGTRLAALLVVCTAAAACATSSEPDAAAAIEVCHGFGCRFTTPLTLDESDARVFASYFKAVPTPQAEREAISRAVRHFEERASRAIGKRDNPKSNSRENGLFGQMDCIDESTNTRALLLHLENQGLLKHHTVAANVTRGILLDARYFHSTAVVRDTAGGSWVVDSWYEPAGGPPDIMPLEEWRKRGVQGER